MRLPLFALALCSPALLAQNAAGPHPPLSPQDELKTIELPEGYRLELVLSEPDIKEPMAIAFDGNGRLYVVEMRTYMQDIDGTGEHDPVSRISRHESSRGDGVYDRHTAYLDNLLLPRMVLPLDDRVLVGVTDTNDITVHRDTNGDGVADEHGVFYEGGARGGNMEHQPSGLVWTLDNWIYTTYNAYRLRWTPQGTALKEPTAPNGGQWGLAQDDFGKPWFSNGGGEKGIWNFQTHVLYAAFNHKDQQDKDWPVVRPLVGLADVQGGNGRFRAEDRTLNHFTATCGQEVFRGDRLPADLRGDVLFCEPVGRLIRRAQVDVREGITFISNPDNPEFIRSRDPNFRPVNLANGPDGCLYIVDTYRGIIQEGNWTREGSYLRKVILQEGLDKNVGRGRIWRLVHRDHKPGPAPRMLDETPAQWVRHLEHPNGWWRDTAQKLLVVRQDKSVVPALTALAREGKTELARQHAVWTLEGLDALTPDLVRALLKDSSPVVRIAAIRASETLLKAGEATLAADIQALGKDADPNVALQVVMTGKLMKWPAWGTTADEIIAAHPSRGVKELGPTVMSGGGPRADEASFSKEELAVLKKGEATFKELCFACHGFDGKGMAMQGQAPGTTMAPPLAKSATVTGHPDALTLVLLHGMSGPVNGKTYEAQMVPMGNNADEWIANVASYIRNSFQNRGSFVTAADVKRLRAAHASRTLAWTEPEVKAMQPVVLRDTKGWKLTASHHPGGCDAAIDGKPDTRWDTHATQVPGQWFQIELPSPTPLAGIRLDTRNSAGDYPRGYKVELSQDGVSWAPPVATGRGNHALTDIYFPATPARFLRVTQTGTVKGLFWSIHELQLLAARAVN